MNENINEVYTLPTEISADLKTSTPFGSISIKVIITGFIVMFFAQKLDTYIYEPLVPLWYVFNILVGVYMIFPSGTNIGKTNAGALLLYFTREKNTYYSIDNPKSYEEMKISVLDERTDDES